MTTGQIYIINLSVLPISENFPQLVITQFINNDNWRITVKAFWQGVGILKQLA